MLWDDVPFPFSLWLTGSLPYLILKPGRKQTVPVLPAKIRIEEVIQLHLWFNKSGLDLKKCGLTKYQLWCIGLCGILTELNGTYHYALEFEKMTQRNIDQMKEGLEEWWGIFNRNDLLKTIHWLEENGHSAEFEDLVELFEENPEITDAELKQH